ncbi:hypothetical protein EGW08_016880, partial [Elysia chlorotica]
CKPRTPPRNIQAEISTTKAPESTRPPQVPKTTPSPTPNGPEATPQDTKTPGATPPLSTKAPKITPPSATKEPEVTPPPQEPKTTPPSKPKGPEATPPPTSKAPEPETTPAKKAAPPLTPPSSPPALKGECESEYKEFCTELSSVCAVSRRACELALCPGKTSTCDYLTKSAIAFCNTGDQLKAFIKKQDCAS